MAFQQWICIDDEFRERYEDRTIPTAEMPIYHQAAVDFVCQLSGASANPEIGVITTAEALDFLARLSEQYDEVAVFFSTKEARRCRLARFFGGGVALLGGGTLTRFDEDVLERAMDNVKAHELLEDPSYCGRLTMGEFRKLLLRAGYSVKVANEAAKERGWNRLVAGEVM